MNDQEILRLWGKAKITGERRPLLYHMLDTANVACAVWETALQRYGSEYYSDAVGLLNNPVTAKNLIAFWIGLHDIGKAFPQFQEQKLVPNPIWHGQVTAIEIPSILGEVFGYSLELAQQLATVLGGHHGVFPRSADLQWIPPSRLGGHSWAEKRSAVAKLLHELLGRPPAPFISCLEQSVAMALAGFVSVADWIASNEELFPFGDEGLDIDAYAQRSWEKSVKALESIHWSGWKPPDEPSVMDTLFHAVRKHGANDLQKTIEKLAHRLDSPGLVIVEAPMGEGKTEAAMYLADTWAAKLKQRGCYFALPTQATSNQMFGRVRKFLVARYTADAVNLMLLHGHAALSAEFETLKENAARIEKFNNIGSDQDDSNTASTCNILAADWFTRRKRGLLAPFGVGTVDQIMLAALQTRFVFVRLFGLAHKTIIVDEVHAYDAYMVTLLERLLEWLASLRCSVVLLSATLPKERTAALMNAYAKGAGLEAAEWKNILNTHAYPRVTWLCGREQGAKTVKTSTRSAKELRIDWVDGRLPESEERQFSLGMRLREALRHGGCAAVICSTVDRAQRLYQALKPFFPEADAGDGFPELDLFHARYMFKDREAREKRALRRFGKPSDEEDHGNEGAESVERPHRAVLVATQVIEQSLDLDFDLMVTDMAPVDLILQRAGRLHRHSRPDRPENLRRPNLWICAPETDKDGVPTFDNGTEAVYDRYVLLRSWLAIYKQQTIGIPEDVEDIIEYVYDLTISCIEITESLQNALSKAQRELLDSKEHAKAEGRQRLIKPTAYSGEIWRHTQNCLEEDSPELHQAHQALTRMSGPSISIVCLNREEWDKIKSRKSLLDVAVVRSLLERAVSLAHSGLVRKLQELQVPLVFKKNALLRHYRILEFEDDEVEIGGYRLRLDRELGIRISKPHNNKEKGSKDDLHI
jgi:CRISPR-associated endonuclease/helicase Cas3